MLETARLIAEKDPHAMFLIAGDGELRQELEATAAALVLPQRRPPHVTKTTVTFRGASYAGVSLLCETLRPILSHTPNVTYSAAIWNALAVA